MTTRGFLRQVRGPARRLPASSVAEDWLSEDDWLGQFERLGREGFFAAEPEFTAALEEYRRAVGRARAQGDPPFDPPNYFLPNLRNSPPGPAIKALSASRHRT